MYKAIIIGSGFSGIAMGIELLNKGVDNFIILEKANSLGGTWRENTYPGAECDIPSALYSYSFEPYLHWKYKWSHQPQILEYLKHCASKYSVLPKINFNQNVISAKWSEEKKLWHLKTNNLDYTAKHVISAVGQLHFAKIPNIKDSDLFQGQSWHSAHWNHHIDLSDKKIGVIGNAASAVQFVPEIAKKAREVKVFQRSANWMLPKQDRLYKEWEKNLVEKMPFLLKAYRLRIWLLGGGLFLMMKSGNNWIRSIYQWLSKRYIKKHIKDPKIIEQLIPKYPLGAKRVLFSDNYYETLARKNVELIIESISNITTNGILTSKHKYDLDIIIYATGFVTNPFLQHIDIQGLNNKSIQEHWANGPRNYLGICTDQFPNLWTMYGPNTNLGHNSIIIMSEAQAKYIAQAIHHTKNKTAEVKADIVTKYYSEIQNRLKSMVWNQTPDSWYKSKSGDIPNNWPGRTLEYMRRTRRWKDEDFIISEA